MMERAGASVAAALFTVISSFAAEQCSRVSSLASSMDFSTKSLGFTSKATEEGEKFIPRFDGLRFLETLVTAHR